MHPNFKRRMVGEPPTFRKISGKWVPAGSNILLQWRIKFPAARKLVLLPAIQVKKLVSFGVFDDQINLPVPRVLGSGCSGQLAKAVEVVVTCALHAACLERTDRRCSRQRGLPPDCPTIEADVHAGGLRIVKDAAPRPCPRRRPSFGGRCPFR